MAIEAHYYQNDGKTSKNQYCMNRFLKNFQPQVENYFV